MANQHCRYCPSGTPDYDALKFQLGSMRGVISMDIDGNTNQVSVDYDDTLVNEKQISRCLNDLGYYPEK